VAFVITVAVRAEVALVFIGCGIIRRGLLRLSLSQADGGRRPPPRSCRRPLIAAGVAPGAMLGKLFTFS